MRKFMFLAFIPALVPSLANAGSIFSDSLPTSNDPTTVLVEDANKEFITKGPNNTAAGFEVGDSVTLFLDFETIAGGPFNGGSFDAEGFGADYRLWAKGVFSVTSIDVTSAPGDDTRIGNIDFGGSLDFYETTGGGDLFVSGTIPGAQAVLDTAGPSIFTLGIAPNSDDFITANGAYLDFADIPPGTSSDSVTADFGLSQIAGDPLPVAPISLSDVNSTLHQFIGDIETRLAIEFDPSEGSVIGDSDEQFDLRTNAAFSFQSVPEPGSIAIWATLALGGCLAARRRLASKS